MLLRFWGPAIWKSAHRCCRLKNSGSHLFDSVATCTANVIGNGPLHWPLWLHCEVNDDPFYAARTVPLYANFLRGFSVRSKSGRSCGFVWYRPLGIFLRRFDWSRPAFLIGFVLSNPAENFTNQAYQVAGSKFRQNHDIGIEYLFSPIVIVLFAITVVSIFLGVRQAKYIMAEGQVATGNKKAPTIFMILLGLYFIFSFYNASLISDRLLTDKIFPMFIAAVGPFCVVTMLIQMVRLPSSHIIFSDREASSGDHPARGLWPTLAWFGFLLTLTSLVGFILALFVFLLASYAVPSGPVLGKTTAYTAVGIMLMVAMAHILNRDFPPGLLQQYITLPWPLT